MLVSFRLPGCFSRTLTAELTEQDAPHAAAADLSRPDGPQDGSGPRVPNQHAAEHSHRTRPIRKDRNHDGPSRRSPVLRRKGELRSPVAPLEF